MQDEVSGGVYHKISCLDFPEFVIPQEETDTLYLAPISTAATADFGVEMGSYGLHTYLSMDESLQNPCVCQGTSCGYATGKMLSG